MPDAVKASIWFVIASIIQKGISFLTTPIFTRIMTTSEYGTFSVYQSWYSMIFIFTSLNLAGGVFNNGMTKYPEKRSEFVSSLLGLTTAITIAFFCLYLFLQESINHLFGLDTLYVMFMFLQLLFEPAYLLWSAKQRYEYKYRSLVIVSILIAFLTPAIGVVCVLLARDKALARVVSSVLTQVCIYIIIYISVFIKGKKFFDKVFWKYALCFNIPLIPHYLSMTVLNQSDRLMIQHFCGNEFVAIYSVAYSISMLMTIVSSAINNSFIPFIYKKMRSEEYNQIRRVSFLLLILMAILSIVPVFLGPELISIIATESYNEAKWIIPPVACAVFFIFLYNIFGTIEFYYEKNHFIMIASIIGAVLNVVLNYIFIPIFGFTAAGYTTLFCYVLFAIFHYLFAHRILIDNDVTQMPFDINKIVLLSIFVIISSCLLTTLYNLTVIRVMLLITVCIIVVMNLKKIKSLLYMLKD